MFGLDCLYLLLIFYGVILQEEWKRKIDGIGGMFHAKVKKGICCRDQFMKIENSKIFFFASCTIYVIYHVTCLLADTNCLVVGGSLNDEVEMRKARYGALKLSISTFFLIYSNTTDLEEF